MSSCLFLTRHNFLFSSVLFLLISQSYTQKVSVSLYYESLCPYCADFIVNHLVKVFEKGLISIVDLRFIPWGNAVIKQDDGSVSCQHGPDECLLNTIDACAIATYPDLESHFRFIYCIERFVLEEKVNQWVNCFQMAGISKAPYSCYTNGNGKQLEQKYALETAKLNPPHRFVPWIVVNGQPLQEDYQNFETYICRAYRGTQVPKACLALLPVNNVSVSADKPAGQVCYADEN